ncbi:MAG: hypothetical protein ACK5IP_01980 [Paracoccus sp. (in: a-proteobacteria)]
MNWDYLPTAFIVCAAPGVGVVHTLPATLGGGLRGGFRAVVGCTIATIFHMVVALAGLAASGRNALPASERAMNGLRRAFALSFAALGLKLALARA